MLADKSLYKLSKKQIDIGFGELNQTRQGPRRIEDKDIYIKKSVFKIGKLILIGIPGQLQNVRTGEIYKGRLFNRPLDKNTPAWISGEGKLWTISAAGEITAHDDFIRHVPYYAQALRYTARQPYMCDCMAPNGSRDHITCACYEYYHLGYKNNIIGGASAGGMHTVFDGAEVVPVPLHQIVGWSMLGEDFIVYGWLTQSYNETGIYNVTARHMIMTGAYVVSMIDNVVFCEVRSDLLKGPAGGGYKIVCFEIFRRVKKYKAGRCLTCGKVGGRFMVYGCKHACICEECSAEPANECQICAAVIESQIEVIF